MSTAAAALEALVADTVLDVYGGLEVVRMQEVEVEDTRAADIAAALAALGRQMNEPAADIPALAGRMQQLHDARAALPATTERQLRRVATGMVQAPAHLRPLPSARPIRVTGWLFAVPVV